MREKMPIIFVGHGSPMNAIENNIYTESWRKIGDAIGKPRAIVIFSAHWITEGETRIATADNHREMIYDMYGFPPELYQVRYDAPGDRSLATQIQERLEKAGFPLLSDPQRSYDHGVWSTLVHMFPDADVPVIPMSLDYHKSPRDHFALGQALAPLRESGIVFVASGNIVHNLRAIDFSGAEHAYPWAREFDSRVAKDIGEKNYEDILDFHHWGDISRLSHPSFDHLLPLFPLLGMVGDDDRVEFFTPDIALGSLSMRSILWK